ncbi:sulfite exporter TauE/SafE family protein [Dermabacter hominis]|uniref:sulfite exporter TauE/SafE family protein n=1 Tax=Dermabacter hominis TaxID=36740 RepID=UPI00242B2563|nr:sulfite exporter TauE/SafE family protein [Dermabacter hominis]
MARRTHGAAAVYGGYFTAAQGVLYMGILGIATSRSMKDVNPVKNLMQLYVNATAAIVYLVAFVFFDAHVWWASVVILAEGGMIGGYVGSHVAKRLPNSVLRATIVVVALVALVRQFV